MKKLLIILSCTLFIGCKEEPITVTYKVDQYISTKGYLVTRVLRKDPNMLGSDELNMELDKITVETNDSIMLIRRKEAEAIIEKFIKVEKYEKH